MGSYRRVILISFGEISKNVFKEIICKDKFEVDDKSYLSRKEF